MMKNRSRWKGIRIATTCLLVLALKVATAESKAKDRPDYLKVVKAYADTLIEHGRDTYGKVHSPLFAAALDRKTLTIEGVKSAAGVRPEDSAVGAANPMHDQNLYQVLYALTEITGEKKYAAEADKALKFFFENCQSPATGLMAWGEHLGWDFKTEAYRINSQYKDSPIHEFFRPWVLWDRCFKLAPRPCEAFAKGLWEHQILSHSNGDFNRHARYDQHMGRGYRGCDFARHAGFYIRSWAHAYRETKDPVYLKAVETLLTHRYRSGDPRRSLSMAIDVGAGAEMVPDVVGEKMREFGWSADNVILSGDEIREVVWPVDNPCCQGHPPARGNYYLQRFRQVGLDGYKKRALHMGDLHVGFAPEPSGSLAPGPFGCAILLMVGCHELSGDEKYLREADRFAALSIDLFLTDGSPLPRATTKETHYEAITQGDTMMMALLKLWLVKNKPDLKVDLVFTDR